MREKNLNRIQYAARLLMLIGVLTGILFSSGEGVQLLPFPVSPEKSEKNSYPVQNGNYKSYSLSTYNSSAHSVLLKIKSKKDIKAPFCGAIYRTECDHKESVQFVPAQGYKERAVFNTPGYLISPSDRAPPAI